MCTLSIIATESAGPGLRAVCNRDEAWEREPAGEPRWRELPGAGVRAIWPTDPRAGGTWIAANSRGLLLAILNLNPEPGPVLPPRELLHSRGLLIPALAGEPDPPSVADRLGALDLGCYAPFRLVAAEPIEAAARGIELTWDRTRLARRAFEQPTACFVSSGLGDSKVLSRLPLFEELVPPGASPEDQDRFHAHSWAERPEISVLMHRRDARTVSITTVRVERTPAGARVDMRHRPVPAPPRPGERDAPPFAVCVPAR